MANVNLLFIVKEYVTCHPIPCEQYVYCRPVGTGQQVGRNFEIISLHNILLKSFTSYLRTSQNIESTLAASNLSGSSAFVSAQDPALIEARFSKLFKVSCRKPLAIAICIKQ